MLEDNALIRIPEEFYVGFSPRSSLYLALAIGGGLFMAGLGVVVAIKAFLMDK